MKRMRKEPLPTDLVLVSGEEDWEALYADGVLLMSGSSLNWPYIIEQYLVGSTIVSFDSFRVKEVWLNDNQFPIELKDIPESVRISGE